MYTAATAAARRRNGQFGVQERPEGDTDLDVGSTDETLRYLRGLIVDRVPPRDVPRHPVNECTGADLPPVAFVGADAYDPDVVTPVRNHTGIPKPDGGTWLSPLHADGTTTWSRWCADVDSGDWVRGKRTHPVGLRPDARVLKVDSMPDLLAAVDAHGGVAHNEEVHLDFEELARHYDAMWVTGAGMEATRYGPGGYDKGENLYSWDIESVLIFNPDAIGST